MVKPNEPKIETPKMILTQKDMMKTYNFIPRDGSGEVFMVEVPDCLFENMQICLIVRDVTAVPRLHYMKNKFRQLWQTIADRGLPTF